jgi:hypothetical protein
MGSSAGRPTAATATARTTSLYRSPPVPRVGLRLQQHGVTPLRVTSRRAGGAKARASRVARPVRVCAANEGGEKQRGFQLKTGEKVAISASVLTAVIGGGASIYGMEEIQVNANPSRGLLPPTVVLLASSEPHLVGGFRISCTAMGWVVTVARRSETSRARCYGRRRSTTPRTYPASPLSRCQLSRGSRGCWPVAGSSRWGWVDRGGWRCAVTLQAASAAAFVPGAHRHRPPV